MNEQEWFTESNALSMFGVAENEGTDRQLRLVAVACCYRVWGLLEHASIRQAVTVAERYADDQASDESLLAAHTEVCRLRDESRRTHVYVNRWSSDRSLSGYDAVISTSTTYRVTPSEVSSSVAYLLGSIAALEAATRSTRQPGRRLDALMQKAAFAAMAQELSVHASLVREVCGNPFSPVESDPEWLTPTVLQLATHIYESRDFSTMPILADALQDAGCDNAEVLNHCRDANATHLRGCWVVDLVLGKS